MTSWATRAGCHVDRAACAWLIRRFLDTDATFVFVDDPDEVQRIRREWEPRPWAPGSRNLYVMLPWRELTGIRLGDDWTRPSMMPVRRTV